MLLVNIYPDIMKEIGADGSGGGLLQYFFKLEDVYKRQLHDDVGVRLPDPADPDGVWRQGEDPVRNSAGASLHHGAG